jgi:hypothetical protein
VVCRDVSLTNEGVPRVKKRLRNTDVDHGTVFTMILTGIFLLKPSEALSRLNLELNYKLLKNLHKVRKH